MDLALFDALSNLEQGDGVIAVPCDHCYRLACFPNHPEALARMRRIRGNPGERLLLIGYDADAFHSYLDEPPFAAEQLMHQHWPGLLEILFEQSLTLPPGLAMEKGNPFLMQPQSDYLRDLLALIPGGTLATLFAARHDELPAREGDGVYNLFGDDVDYVLRQDEEIDAGLQSTLISIGACGAIRVLRSGRVVLD